MIERFVELLVRELALEKQPVKDVDGCYRVDLEPDLHVVMMQREDLSVRFFSSLAPLPTSNRGEFLRFCMTGNLLGRETGGAILGVEDDKLCLSMHLPSGLNERKLREFFEDFVNYADAWRQENLLFSEVNG